jgi:hypothetical protein
LSSATASKTGTKFTLIQEFASGEVIDQQPLVHICGRIMERSISERYSNDLGLSTIQKPIDTAIGEPSDAETTRHTKHN